MDRVRSPWLIGFGLVAVAQLAFVVFPVPQLADLIAVSILAPALAVWVWRVDGPKVLVLALAFCAVGDVLGNPRRIGLDQSGLLLSVAAFAVAQACLIVLFVRSGALAALQASISGRQRWRSVVALLYLVAAVMMFWSIWGGLGPALRVAVGVYLLLLVGTATTSLALDTWAGMGVALFAGSMALVAAEMVDGVATWHRLLIRLMYQLGLLLIAVAVVNRALRLDRDMRRGRAQSEGCGT
ncbi:lysoplasmalogenase family protein [Nonomuraea typhae]|uniref:Lysoplasmalogenase family protein n=1 Tax=Nonomuraea typhae TaxID=2603600 RepID=A0ABW7YZC8_9ACTN